MARLAAANPVRPRPPQTAGSPSRQLSHAPEGHPAAGQARLPSPPIDNSAHKTQSSRRDSQSETARSPASRHAPAPQPAVLAKSADVRNIQAAPHSPGIRLAPKH